MWDLDLANVCPANISQPFVRFIQLHLLFSTLIQYKPHHLALYLVYINIYLIPQKNCHHICQDGYSYYNNPIFKRWMIFQQLNNLNMRSKWAQLEEKIKNNFWAEHKSVVSSLVIGQVGFRKEQSMMPQQLIVNCEQSVMPQHVCNCQLSNLL